MRCICRRKSHVCANKLDVQETDFSFTHEKLCHLFSRLHFLSRHESKVRTLVLRALSGFINQPETDLMVHALQLPLHSPMGTMFASAPSKVPRSTSRTSHPSRLSPEVVLHVEHSGGGSAAAWPASSCSRVRVDKRGVRSRPVASLWT